MELRGMVKSTVSGAMSVLATKGFTTYSVRALGRHGRLGLGYPTDSSASIPRSQVLDGNEVGAESSPRKRLEPGQEVPRRRCEFCIAIIVDLHDIGSIRGLSKYVYLSTSGQLNTLYPLRLLRTP